MKRFILSFLLVCIFLSARAQDSTLDELAFYGDIIAHAEDAKHRQRAHDNFYPLFTELLAQEGSYKLPIEQIRWLSIKESDDKLFRIYTWQLKLDEDTYEYFGFIHTSEGAVFNLMDTKEGASDLEYVTGTPEDWYGSLYYNIIPFGNKKEKTYLLFGYDGNEKFNHRKIVDVLWWEDGMPRFGKEVFKRSEKGERPDIKSRLVLQYSSDANVTVNYNPSLDMVVHEHLINRMGRIPGQGPTFLPDGSYVGYKYDGSYWNYIDKIYDQVSDSAPRPFPVFKKEK